MEYYARERKELLLFTTAWMELESITLSEISQVVKDKHYMISPKWNLRKKQNKTNKQTKAMKT